jgi:methylmalonyl-CoA/ethylmalonyl-CoA epimerase
MTTIHIDHVSLCVRDLEAAIADWTDIFGVLGPQFLENLTHGHGTSDGTAMRWATFQNPDPTGVSIQLWAPGDESSWVHALLDKRGEFVHHIAFLSSNFGHTIQECTAAGLPLVLEEASAPDTMPWLKWNFIPEAKTHGVLIELATRYQAGQGEWLPHPGNAENAHVADQLRAHNAPHAGGSTS